MRGKTLLGLVLLVALLLARTGAARAAPLAITFQLTAAQVVPAPSSVVSGFAQVIYDSSSSDLSFSFTLFGVSPGDVTGVDLHRGSPGTNGEVVRQLSAGGAAQASGRTTLSQSEAFELLNGVLYVDVHTRQQPDGAARGQIVPPGVIPPPPTPVPPPPSVSQETTLAAGQRSVIRPPDTGDAGLR